MKGAWEEFRMYLAEACLEIACRLAPKSTADGVRLIGWMYAYFECVHRHAPQSCRKEPPR